MALRVIQLTVVDLAERENERTTKVTAEQMKELTFIKRSLFHLANVISALTSGEPCLWIDGRRWASQRARCCVVPTCAKIARDLFAPGAGSS